MMARQKKMQAQALALICTMTGLWANADAPVNTDTASQWQLVWQDEFNQDNIDTTKWIREQNCWGGGNNESQCYTADADTAFIQNGVLNIVAIKRPTTGASLPVRHPDYNAAHSRTLAFSSARLLTQGKADWRYGRFEIRARLPFGQGTWPAIWMLPSEDVYGSWAASGEIDIMEAVNLKTPSDADDAEVGETESRVHGTLHYGASWPYNTYSGNAFKFAPEANPADHFNLYAIEWEQGEIRWYINDVLYATQTQEDWHTDSIAAQGNAAAPFDQPFHLILNLAVGGDWAGTVNDKGIDESVFPQRMLVDYVRVYQCGIDPDTGKGCGSD